MNPDHSSSTALLGREVYLALNRDIQAMKNILILGAGRSSSALIRHLANQAASSGFQIRVGDAHLASAIERTAGFAHATAFEFHLNNEALLEHEVKQAELVISMLPAFMHPTVIQSCIRNRKNIITPSYITPEIQAMDAEAREAGIFILGEMGVDPGIDHMSAMAIVDDIRTQGGEITRFESFTGGLIAPESDNNPWNYKFTWNPRNVVLAGAGGAAMFLQEGQLKYIPYHKLFSRVRDIEIEGYGRFEGYANRDSLRYREVYGMQDIKTLYRGTLRKAGYCKAWDVFVQLGMTDDTYTMNSDGEMTCRDFVNAFLSFDPHKSIEEKLIEYLDLDQPTMNRLIWLGLFDKKPLGITNATPAQILQKILEEKWVLEPNDKDMIVMWHLIKYNLNGAQREVKASMVVKGEDNVYSAMANTVGLPIALAAELILNNQMQLTGVCMPIASEIYSPILAGLKRLGIEMVEKHVLA